MLATTRVRTMADVVGRSSFVRDATLVLGASLATGLVSQFEIRLPWTPVPITLQTLAVLLSGAVLGSRRGALAMLAYLAEGALGLPFFAGGASGPAHLVGPTGGFLFGFVIAAWWVGCLAERGWDRSPASAFVAMLSGNALLYVVGLTQLAFFVPRAQLLEAGLLPFLTGAILKIVLAALLLPGAWRVLEHVGLCRPRGTR